ncbi:MAG: YdeI family protein [Gemmatimonadales bacterium]
MPPLKVGEVREFRSAREWSRWLAKNHDAATELWLRFAKKGADRETVTRAEALEVALCHGWIDGQSRSENDAFWLQRFTPRTRRSKWSKINCEAAERLIAAGKMQPSGLAVVEAAKADGRWDAAYASPRHIAVPQDLERALKARPKARKAFGGLDARNRYAILYRIHDAKRPETRARRIEKYVAMLERGETIYPQRYGSDVAR